VNAVSGKNAARAILQRWRFDIWGLP